MSEEARQNSQSPDVKPRPVWMQLAVGLLMGILALVALSVLLRNAGV